MACIVWREVGLNGMSLLRGNSACKIGEYTGQDPQSTHKQLRLYLLQKNTNCTPDTKLTMLGQVDSQCCLMCGHTLISCIP